MSGWVLGILGGSAIAAALRVAQKPDGYTWRQLGGAALLAGIGFTMSLFIAGVSFPDAGDLAAAKLAVFGGSLVAAACGVAVLWMPRRGPRESGEYAASGAAREGTPV